MDIFNVLTMVGGLALFLYGMNIMGDGLAKTSGGKLEAILERFTSSPIKAVLLGAGVTAVIQSSSATTVMVVGFVNSGIMKLTQAVGIIMGANVGTTITSWILSLTDIQGESVFIKLLKPSSFSPVLAMIGVSLILFSKSMKKKDIGTILAGFAILMTGMDTMSAAVKPLAEIEEFTSIFLMFSDNPLIGVVVGALLTAVIQSSSASVGILQALCLTGSVSYASALPIIMGQNIGTCVTALLSAIGASKNARRAAFVHFYFNIIGTVIFMVLFYVINAVVNFSFMEEAAGAAGIAIIHSCFNVTATAVLLPFRDILVKIATLTVRDDKAEAERSGLKLLDERFLEKPSFALGSAKKAAVEMAYAAQEALNEAISLINQYDKGKAKKVMELEDMVDHYEDELGAYLMKINNADLSLKDSQSVSMMLHCIGDFERISDHACNVMETVAQANKKGAAFSDKAKEELAVYESAVQEIVSMTCKVFDTEDTVLAVQVEPLEEVIDTLNEEIKKKHVKRLRKGKCTIEVGFVLSDLTTNFERIADHCSNIAISLIQMKEDGLESHGYLDNLKENDNPEFLAKYKEYRKKYKLP
ncbi:Na/Pi cotransporter family protein [bacterium D16-51]|nr:Na/Pi cotransporter family protein [bacterium D16-59]RKI57342.1 Na/Pi cotransporter family protein [bacterium D16-51]